jgi:hypothetical protein
MKTSRSSRASAEKAFTVGRVARVRVHNPGSAAVFATAGYHRHNTAGGGGIGLWLARQLADVVTPGPARRGRPWS